MHFINLITKFSIIRNRAFHACYKILTEYHLIHVGSYQLKWHCYLIEAYFHTGYSICFDR